LNCPLSRGKRRGGGKPGGGEEEGAKGHVEYPQRNSAVVDCIIWSAALITLAFIS
jgi:hypothetical protein